MPQRNTPGPFSTVRLVIVVGVVVAALALFDILRVLF